MSRPDRLVAALLLCAAVVLLAVGGAITAAGVGRVRAEAFMADWAAKGEEPSAAAWQAAQVAAADAVARYPVRSGDYEDRLGRVYLWRHFRQPFGAAAAREGREQAVAAFTRALQARPVAPATQARLAHAHLYLLQLDERFTRPYHLARAQGPWRVEVNRELAEIGLVAWPSLDPARREEATTALCTAISLGAAGRDSLLALARRAGVPTSACRSAGT